MERRNFISKNIFSGVLLSTAFGNRSLLNPDAIKLANQEMDHPSSDNHFFTEEVVVERVAENQPHKGKVLAVIQPHSDDIAFFAAGTVAKLIYEGYTGYLIRTSNDDAAGAGASMGERVYNNEKDNEAVAKLLGLKKVYSLNYNNHRMDQYNIQDLKSRFIFLFRLLKVDTLVCYDPWGHYEENPDHYVTAKAVEAARWMSGMATDYPEQLEVVSPHTVSEMYYFARGPQLVNRVVDIGRFIDKKVEANLIIKNQGIGAGNMGAMLRKQLAEKNLKLRELGDTEESANFNFIKEFALDKDSEYMRGVASDRKVGQQYGLEWGERFHYIKNNISIIDEYVKKNALAL